MIGTVQQARVDARGQTARLGLFLLDRGQSLLFEALEFLFGKGRTQDHVGQQAQRLGQAAGQAVEQDQRGIQVGAGPDGSRQLFFAPRQAQRIVLAGTLAEHVQRHSRGAGLFPVIGGVAGGLLGSQFGSGSGQLIATGVGTLLGAAVGGSAGQSLDRADALYAERAYSDSIYSQGPVHWRNPRSGHHGQFEAGPAYNHGGRQCKQIESTFYGPNGPYQNYATACRMPDGSWRTI